MINVLIPMGGKGQRFKDAGYSLTKPLIDVNGQPMIKRVIDNLNITGTHIFLVSEEDEQKHHLTQQLTQFCFPNQCQVILENPNLRQGAGAACLLAEHLIDNDDQLLVANSDQLIEWDSNQFLTLMANKMADGGIITFTATESKWSFAKLIPNTQLISEVAEKKPISNKATAGVYWFKQGKDFVAGIKQMMHKQIKTNGEYYVCPVFNELIAESKQIYDYPVDNFFGIGTPEDLERYLSDQDKSSRK
jgi:dTDP-glucose pyrophosphorylase